MTNPIADPLVEVTDTDAASNLVHIEATPVIKKQTGRLKIMPIQKNKL